MKTFKDGYELNPTDDLGFAKMRLACNEFKRLTNGAVIGKVEQIWADLGAGAWWWQIAIYRSNGRSFQLGGNDRQKILNACCMEEITAAVLHCIEEYPDLYK